MAKYLITGASRGLGFEFLTQASENPRNTVIGMVRSRENTLARIAKELPDRKNIHIVEGDLASYQSLERAARETAEITGGVLDYLIANAGLISPASSYRDITSLSDDPELLEKEMYECFKINAVGQTHLFNYFVPLILKSDEGKVIAITSAHASLDLTNQYHLRAGPPYAISKAALNMVVAKFDATYGPKGVLFMAVCPGAVDTTPIPDNYTEKEMEELYYEVGQFQKHAPDFAGPVQPEVPVRKILALAEKAKVSDGYGGAFLSHLGTDKKWI